MHKLKFLSLSVLLITTSALGFFSCGSTENQNGPYFATGIKIGEITPNDAIVWMRLTKDSTRVWDAIKPKVSYFNPVSNQWEPRQGRQDLETRVIYPQGYDVRNIEGAVPGIFGYCRVKYKEENGAWKSTQWFAVDSLKDFTCQIQLKNLNPNTTYKLVAESSYSGKENASEQILGTFKTAPKKDQLEEVRFMVTTGQAYDDMDSLNFGFKIYPSMLELNPNFFVHTGDIVYYDNYAKNIELAKWHWQRTYSLPSNVIFHQQVGSYFIKDDHDTWMNDCWPGQKTRFMGDFTFNDGQEIFRYEVPMQEKTYRTFRWGKDLQIWLVEGRDFRSPNSMPDGPDKTIWGTEQMEWFKKTVQDSNASFRILISPTPIVGPDRTRKNDNHANSGFAHEGNVIRDFISSQENMFVICGDRHWQYFSVDERTGVKEFSCGPASDEHAGGWTNDQLMPNHKYLSVIGGFLCVEISRSENIPHISFKHYGVNGKLLHEYAE